MKNLKVAEIFRDVAKILEIKQDNVFRIRAYEKAAQNIESLTEDLDNFISRDKLTDIPGVGKDLSDKLHFMRVLSANVTHDPVKSDIKAGVTAWK